MLQLYCLTGVAALTPRLLSEQEEEGGCPQYCLTMRGGLASVLPQSHDVDERRMDLHASALLGTRIVVGLRVPLGLARELLLIGMLSKNTSLELMQGKEQGLELNLYNLYVISALNSKIWSAAGTNLLSVLAILPVSPPPLPSHFFSPSPPPLAVCN